MTDTDWLHKPMRENIQALALNWAGLMADTLQDAMDRVGAEGGDHNEVTSAAAQIIAHQLDVIVRDRLNGLGSKIHDQQTMRLVREHCGQLVLQDIMLRFMQIEA